MNTNWLDTQMYPFTPHYIQCNGAQLHYIDEGSGPVILFVHGTPSWSFEFRDVIKKLSSSFRCIAFDHIGFGLSDKPADYPYTLDQHVQNMQQLIKHLSLTKFALVAHDFGGPIGLRVAGQNPDAVSHIILANTWCFSVAEEPDFKRMKAILGSPLLPFLYRRFNFSAKYILPSAFGEKSRLTKAIHKQYTAPFSTASERNGTLAFAHSLLRDQEWFEATGKACSVLKDKPVLLLWGQKDNFVTEKYLHKTAAYFPKAEIIQYPDAGHFVFEEKGVVIAGELVKRLGS